MNWRILAPLVLWFMNIYDKHFNSTENINFAKNWAIHSIKICSFDTQWEIPNRRKCSFIAKLIRFSEELTIKVKLPGMNPFPLRNLQHTSRYQICGWCKWLGNLDGSRSVQSLPLAPARKDLQKTAYPTLKVARYKVKKLACKFPINAPTIFFQHILSIISKLRLCGKVFHQIYRQQQRCNRSSFHQLEAYK